MPGPYSSVGRRHFAEPLLDAHHLVLDAHFAGLGRVGVPIPFASKYDYPTLDWGRVACLLWFIYRNRRQRAAVWWKEIGKCCWRVGRLCKNHCD